MTAVLGVVGILLVLTGWVTWQVRDRNVKAVWVAPLWGVLGTVGLVGGAGAYYFNARLVYERCVVTAERSASGRVQTIQLYDTIDEATGTDQYTTGVVLSDGRPSLREALEINLPVLKVEDCPKP